MQVWFFFFFFVCRWYTVRHHSANVLKPPNEIDKWKMWKKMTPSNAKYCIIQQLIVGWIYAFNKCNIRKLSRTEEIKCELLCVLSAFMQSPFFHIQLFYITFNQRSFVVLIGWCDICVLNESYGKEFHHILNKFLGNVVISNYKSLKGNEAAREQSYERFIIVNNSMYGNNEIMN